MKKEILIIIAVVAGLILLVLGFSSGYSLGQKWAKVESSLTDLLESKVISGLSTVVSGEIIEISGRNLTLSKKGDTLNILVREDTSIYRLVPPEETTETLQPAGEEEPVVTEEIEFGEIKVGDRVSISCQLKADGTIEGLDIMVFLAM